MKLSKSQKQKAERCIREGQLVYEIYVNGEETTDRIDDDALCELSKGSMRKMIMIFDKIIGVLVERLCFFLAASTAPIESDDERRKALKSLREVIHAALDESLDKTYDEIDFGDDDEEVGVLN